MDDILGSILERISQMEEQRDALLREAELEEAKIAKLEQLYYLLEDPVTSDLLRDAVVGMAVQNGVAVPANGNNGGNGAEKHYVGMQRVREYVAAMAAASGMVSITS